MIHVAEECDFAHAARDIITLTLVSKVTVNITTSVRSSS